MARLETRVARIAEASLDEDRGLTPSEGEYRDLQFIADGDSHAERAYRTHWGSTVRRRGALEHTTQSL